MTYNIVFAGGLGNQMFQYALYYALKMSGKDVNIDTSLYGFNQMHNGYELNKVFLLNKNTYFGGKFHLTCLRVVLKFQPSFLLTSDKKRFDISVLSKPKKIIYGYWQSDKYFMQYKDDIKKCFTFKNIHSTNIEIASRMKEENSVSIHIRRGDYLYMSQYTGICTKEYYRAAIAYISKHVNSPHFYIFSNDPEWSKTFTELAGINYTLINHNTGDDSYQDMYLMTQCHHNILANSSFSWWGAYLNSYEGAIKIAPLGWDNTDSEEYNSIRVPENYIRL